MLLIGWAVKNVVASVKHLFQFGKGQEPGEWCRISRVSRSAWPNAGFNSEEELIYSKILRVSAPMTLAVTLLFAG
tara:strand:+ start:2264 stop:2488 length:225 start_codon:yes stop_codon:yes gene_type:complete